MGATLPPVNDPARLQELLSHVSTLDRADATQEAWLAHLEGRDPYNAAQVYANRERRLRKSGTLIPTDDDGHPTVTDTNANDPSDLSDPLGPIET